MIGRSSARKTNISQYKFRREPGMRRGTRTNRCPEATEAWQSGLSRWIYAPVDPQNLRRESKGLVGSHTTASAPINGSVTASTAADPDQQPRDSAPKQ